MSRMVVKMSTISDSIQDQPNMCHSRNMITHPLHSEIHHKDHSEIHQPYGDSCGIQRSSTMTGSCPIDTLPIRIHGNALDTALCASGNCPGICLRNSLKTSKKRKKDSLYFAHSVRDPRYLLPYLWTWVINDCSFIVRLLNNVERLFYFHHAKLEKVGLFWLVRPPSSDSTICNNFVIYTESNQPLPDSWYQRDGYRGIGTSHAIMCYMVWSASLYWKASTVANY